jgi:hypothetical protein
VDRDRLIEVAEPHHIQNRSERLLAHDRRLARHLDDRRPNVVRIGILRLQRALARQRVRPEPPLRERVVMLRNAAA